MTSPKNINIFDFNGVNVAKHWQGRGEVFAISDCLVVFSLFVCVCVCVYVFPCVCVEVIHGTL